jgi:hypothetical protein
MSQRPQSYDDTQLKDFAQRLRQFRSTLPQSEQQLVDALVLTACSEQGEVHGYGLDRAMLKRLLEYWVEGPAQLHDAGQSELSGPARDYERTTRARAQDSDI